MDVMMRRRELMGMQGVLKTVSGPIVTVNDALARNAKSLVVNFAPVQAAGTPAPDNVLPISGWTGVTGYRTGGNVWDEEWEVGLISADTGNNVTNSDYSRTKNYIAVKPGEKYNFLPVSKRLYLRLYSINKTYITYVQLSAVSSDTRSYTVPSGVYYLRFVWDGNTYSNDISVNYPATDTTYHPYTGTTYPVDWTDTAGTVYGGYVDLVSGVLVAEWAGVDMGEMSWHYYTGSTPNFFYVVIDDVLKDSANNSLCPVYKYAPSMSVNNNSFQFNGNQLRIRSDSYSDASDFKSALSGQIFVYPLLTPITYQLTPQTIAMLKGTNNVWANANGNTELTYYAQ